MGQDSETTQARLILWAAVDWRQRPATWALLYPADAGSFTTPLAILRLPAHHQVPPIGVGDHVEVRGLHGDHPTIVAAGMAIEAGEPVDEVPEATNGPVSAVGDALPARSRPPGFAEARGGPVVTHPDHGTTSMFAWGGRGGSPLHEGRTQGSEAWQDQRWALRLGIAVIVVMALAIIGAMVAEIVGWWDLSGGGSWRIGGSMAAALAGIPYLWRRLQRRRRVRDGREELDHPATEEHELRLCLWFAAGDDGRPVVPWLTLYPRDGANPLVSLPVLDAPSSWRPDPGTACRVRGRPEPGEVVLVSVDIDGEPHTLHPADVCTDEVMPVEAAMPS